MLKTGFRIETDSQFAKREVDGDDITQWTEERFHSAVHDVVEDFLTGDEFTHLVLDKMSEDLHAEEIKEFNELGDIKISITGEETITAFAPPPEKVLPKEQRNLMEFA